MSIFREFSPNFCPIKNLKVTILQKKELTPKVLIESTKKTSLKITAYTFETAFEKIFSVLFFSKDSQDCFVSQWEDCEEIGH